MILEPEYKEVNGRRVPKKMVDYTIDELRCILTTYHSTLDRQHGRNPKISADQRVYQDDAKEKKRLWNNYRSIISRHQRAKWEA